MNENSTPKLSLLLTRSSMWEWDLDLAEAQGCKTPPIIAPLSIPFKWEEAPGKPKPRDIIPSVLSASKSLHLPPRLLVHDHGSPAKLFAVRSRSYSSRAADLAWRKFDSPTSILNSPPSSTTSRGSSTCSQDIGSGDEVARPQNQHSSHKMRRLFEHWTPSFRWPKLKEECSLHHDDHKQGIMTSPHMAPPTNKWVLRKMKRSSRVLGTILKRMRRKDGR